MSHVWMKRLLPLFILTLLVACGGQTDLISETATPATAGRSIVLGDISDEAAETIRGTQPLADYLATHLADQGITKGEVKIAPDLETMIQWIEAGEVDLYFDSPYPVLVISEETGARPILRRLRFGVSEYHSVFFVRNDSPIMTLTEVMGQVVAFEESFSTSGYMLPLAYLISQGYNPVEVTSPTAAANPDTIAYTFSTADDTTIQWVISGVVPVGVIDNITFQRLPEETQAQLRIIERTDDVPRQMVLVRPGMDEALVEAITDVLLAMEEDEAGQAALEEFQTTEFDEFPEGYAAAMEQMQSLYGLVQER